MVTNSVLLNDTSGCLKTAVGPAAVGVPQGGGGYFVRQQNGGFQTELSLDGEKAAG
jgi:hypothetical protein